MSQQERIKLLQNNTDMLYCQYSAKYYYNKAERYIIVVSICSLLSALCLFIPDSLDKLGLFFPLVLDLLIYILYSLMEKAVTEAALLRNHFDNAVLGFNSSTDSRKIQSLISKATAKKGDTLQIQISNTGNDNPPGVKDWYEFSQDYSDSDIVFECQKQNRWWDKEIHKRSTIILYIILTLVLASAILVTIFSHTPLEKICACFLGLIIALIPRIIAHRKYNRLSIEIDKTCQLLDISRNKKLIIALQEQIESRRKLPVIELNIVHKKKSKQLSKEYSFISKGS